MLEMLWWVLYICSDEPIDWFSFGFETDLVLIESFGVDETALRDALPAPPNQ